MGFFSKLFGREDKGYDTEKVEWKTYEKRIVSINTNKVPADLKRYIFLKNADEVKLKKMFKEYQEIWDTLWVPEFRGETRKYIVFQVFGGISPWIKVEVDKDVYVFNFHNIAVWLTQAIKKGDITKLMVLFSESESENGWNYCMHINRESGGEQLIGTFYDGVLCQYTLPYMSMTIRKKKIVLAGRDAFSTYLNGESISYEEILKSRKENNQKLFEFTLYQ